MQFTDLISRVNGLGSYEEAAIYFKALRQDKLVWDGFKKFAQDPYLVEYLIKQGQLLNPGSLGLILHNSEFTFQDLKTGKIHAESLERSMLGYEEYLLSGNLLESVEEAARIALALLAKYQVESDWTMVFKEINSRTRKGNNYDLSQVWESILCLVINLIEDQKLFLTSLAGSLQPAMAINLAIHSIFSLPVKQEEQVSLLGHVLGNLNVQDQVSGLRKLKKLGGLSFTSLVAQNLLRIEKVPEFSQQSTADYWKDASTSTLIALEIQGFADIAQFAGDTQLATSLNDKALEIFSALVKRGKVKKASLSGHEEIGNSIAELFSSGEISDPDIQSEIIYSQAEESIKANDQAHPIEVLRTSKRIAAAGNPELAREEIHSTLSLLSDAELEKLLVDGPAQIQSWDPEAYLHDLVEMGAYEEAGRVSRILLHDNPTSFQINLESALAADGRGDYQVSSGNWETLSLLQPGEARHKRRLAYSLRQLAENDKAFEVYKEIVSIEKTADKDDLLAMSEIAITLDRPTDALSAAKKILDEIPDHIKALTLAGIAYKKNGQKEQAEESLQKAIHLSGEDSRPWLELSDLQWMSGERDKALVTLQEATLAIPADRELKKDYARKLMQENLVSEAYPRLQALSTDGNDLDIDLLLIEAMDTLGIENIDDTLEELVGRYPNDSRFLAEYGERLVWKGETERGLILLQNAGAEVFNNDQWTLAFVEATAHPDLGKLLLEQHRDEIDTAKNQEWLERILSAEPENQRARLLTAELFLRKGSPDSAYEIFNDLVNDQSGKNLLDASRVYAGLALAAGRTGQVDIARAALDQALDLKPDCLGLIPIHAEILHLSGDDQAAIEQVKMVLLKANEDPENLIWAVEFLQKIGALEVARDLIMTGVERHSQHLGLFLMGLESDLLTAETVQVASDTEKLYSLVQKSENPKEMLRAAILFATFGNEEKTEYCLEKAASTGSSAALFNLAGLFRIKQDYPRALEYLDRISSFEVAVQLFKNEIYISEGKFDNITLSNLSDQFDQHDIPIADPFYPAAWKDLVDSTRPQITLATRLALLTGKSEGLMESIRQWNDENTDSDEARVFGVELSLAMGDEEGYEYFIEGLSKTESGSYSSQLMLLQEEYRLEKQVPLEKEEIDFELFESLKANEPDKISRIRQYHRLGRVPESETNFEMAMSLFAEPGNRSLIKQIGIIRNLAKSAIVLSRWADAQLLIKSALSLAPKNLALKLLDIRLQALNSEYQERIKGFQVVAHAGIDFVSDEKADDEKWEELTSSSFNFDSYNRWQMRQDLARDPSQENIRQLAQLSPCAEDAAALIAGLRRNGQAGTALKVGKKFADDPVVLFEMALCSAVDDPKQALELLDHSIAADPYQPLTFYYQAKLYQQVGLMSNALHSLEAALDLWPNEPRWHLEAAEILRQLGNMEKPIEHLRLASFFTPGDIEIKKQLGIASLKANKPADALTSLSAVVQQRPDDCEAWTALSEVHLINRNLELAREAAEKAVQVDPSKVYARLQAGKVSWSQGEYEKAMEQVRLAISLSPEDPDNYVFMARLFVEQGKKKEALEMLEKASQSKTANVRTVIEHANLIKEINGSVAARDLIASFSQRFPENPDLLMLLAEAEDQCGETKKAASVARKALDIHPGEKDVHLLMGKILEKDGNLDQAAHHFSQAVAIDPSLVDGYLNLSQVYIKQRDHGKARETLEKGISNIPGKVSLYLACASLLKEVKDYNGAEQMLRKASSLEPRNVGIHRQLGAILALNMVHQSQEVSTQI